MTTDIYASHTSSCTERDTRKNMGNMSAMITMTMNLFSVIYRITLIQKDVAVFSVIYRITLVQKDVLFFQ